jgi:type II secretory pathway component PulJ
MTMEAAQQQLDTSEPEIAKKDKIIRERMAEIATLKAQLTTAERSLTLATNAKKKIQEKNKEALIMVQSDASLIMAKVKKAMNGYGGSGAPETVGLESMEDMITLGNDEDIMKLAQEWANGLPRSLCAVLGTIQSIQAACKKQQVQVSPPALVSAITTLIQRVFDTVVKDSSSSYTTTDKLGVKSWPLIASAMNLTENLGQEYYDLLSNAVMELAKNMKEKNNSKLSWSDKNKDYVVDLLLPVHDAIESEIGSSIKAAFMQEIKAGLISSVSEIETVKNYAMPAEAEIARKQRFPQVANFLASSTETTLNLNLSKAGRMAVHRLIDNQMGYGKVRHSSVDLDMAGTWY